VDPIEAQGRALFERACQLDLEGIVAKRKDSLYRATEKPSLGWIKIKNPNYSQAEGRQELFEQPAQSLFRQNRVRRRNDEFSRRFAWQALDSWQCLL
jgi:hypothetical protein